MIFKPCEFIYHHIFHHCRLFFVGFNLVSNIIEILDNFDSKSKITFIGFVLLIPLIRFLVKCVVITDIMTSTHRLSKHWNHKDFSILCFLIDYQDWVMAKTNCIGSHNINIPIICKRSSAIFTCFYFSFNIEKHFHLFLYLFLLFLG